MTLCSDPRCSQPEPHRQGDQICLWGNPYPGESRWTALAAAAEGQDAEERLEAKPGKAAREAGNAQPGAPHDQ